MQVRMKRQRSGAWFSADRAIVWPRPGVVLDLPETLAEEVIASGDGEPVEAPKPDPVPESRPTRKAVKRKVETRG